MLVDLYKLASEVADFFEMADVMYVDFSMLRALRREAEWFDELISRLESRAAYVRSVMGN